MNHVVLIVTSDDANNRVCFDRPNYLLTVNGQSLLERLCFVFEKIASEIIITSGDITIKNKLSKINCKIKYVYEKSNCVNEMFFYGLNMIKDDCHILSIVDANVILSKEVIQQYFDIKSNEKLIVSEMLTSNGNDNLLRNKSTGKHLISNIDNKSSFDVLGRYMGIITLPYATIESLKNNFVCGSGIQYMHYLQEYIENDFSILFVNENSADKIDNKKDYQRILTQFNYSYIDYESSVSLPFTNNKSLYKFIGVYDVLGGQVAQKTGFDGLWLGSYQISLSNGLNDDMEYDANIALNLAIQLKNRYVNLPVIIDAGSGFEDKEKLKIFVSNINLTNVVAICIDDNMGERFNSMITNKKRRYLPAGEFVTRLVELKKHMPDHIKIIARTEMLTIDGDQIDMGELNYRCHRICQAGIDAFLPHYVGNNMDFISNILQKLRCNIPVFLIPTGLLGTHQKHFHNLNVKLVIYANLDIRSRVQTNIEMCSQLMLESHLNLKNEQHLCSPDFIWNMVDSLRES